MLGGEIEVTEGMLPVAAASMDFAERDVAMWCDAGGEIIHGEFLGLLSKLGVTNTSLLQVLSQIYNRDQTIKPEYQAQLKEHEAEVLAFCSKYGYVDEDMPLIPHYPVAIVNGAFPEERFGMVKRMLDCGITFDQLFVITTTGVELAGADGSKTNELENMKRVCDSFGISEKIADIVYIDAAAYDVTRTAGIEHKKTANTADTVIELFKEYSGSFTKVIDEVKEVLVVSNQPYNLYQKNVFDMIASEHFTAKCLKTLVAGSRYLCDEISTIFTAMIKNIFYVQSKKG